MMKHSSTSVASDKTPSLLTSQRGVGQKLSAFDADTYVSQKSALREICPTPRDFLPNGPNVAIQVRDRVADQFEPPVSLNEYEYHDYLRYKLRAITTTVLVLQRGVTMWDRLRLTMKAYFRKNELFHTIQAVSYLEARAAQMDSIHRFLREETSHSYEQYCECQGIDEASCSAKVKLLNILVYYLMTAIPSWKVQQLGATTDKFQDMCAIELLLKMPVPPNLRNQATYSHYKLSPIHVESSPVSHAEIHHDWLGVDTPLVDAGRDYAFMMGLRRVHEIVLAERSAEQKKLVVLEDILLASYRNLLSGVLGVLRTQLDAADSLRSKVLGCIGTAALILARFLFNRYMIDDVSAIVQEYGDWIVNVTRPLLL